jgi:5-methylcytosine-specific restriction endonuclease McrA
MKRITDRQRAINLKHAGVLALYKTGKYTTERIAKNYDISVRQVQRIAGKAGVIRSQAEANRVAAPLKNYRTIPIEMRVKRKQLGNKQRYIIISSHPYCVVCGMKPLDGVRLEVDHIDENPLNNDVSNLQVLCTKCNNGKSQLARFGA